MLSFALISFLALCITEVIAVPADRVLPKRATCTPASLGDTTKDDTPAIKAAITSCGKGGIIVIPAGRTYNIRSPLDFTGCVNCDFQLEGTLRASSDWSYWKSQTAFLILKNIAGVKIRSLTGSGVIDGNGQSSYDEFVVATFARPTAIHVSGGSNVLVTGFTIKNPPNVFINQNGGTVNANYASLTMTAASKSTNLPKNTDGFDIGESTYTTIKDVYVSNQDDCIAFKSGCNYVTVDGITCTGTNHGISVGSLGQTNKDTVKNVYITNAKMSNCAKAGGIKLYPGGSAHGTSTVSNVTYDGVVVDNCDYGFQVQSCYGETAAYCTAHPSAASITGLYIKNFSGTTSSKKSPAVSDLDCPPDGTCDLYFKNWAVKNPSGSAVNYCANIDNSPGITCTSGASG